MIYANELRANGWQRRRLEILQRDGWTCVACGLGTDDRVLNVHHRRYPDRGRPIWDVPDEHLETLCESCHEATHRPGDMRFDHLTLAEMRDAYCTLIGEQLSGTLSIAADQYASAKLDQLCYLIAKARNGVTQQTCNGVTDSFGTEKTVDGISR